MLAEGPGFWLAQPWRTLPRKREVYAHNRWIEERELKNRRKPQSQTKAQG
jgi:hypothetical protein